MLPDGPDVEQVVAGDDGVLTAAKPGSVLVDMSTIAPDTARRLAAVIYLREPANAGRTPDGAAAKVRRKAKVK